MVSSVDSAYGWHGVAARHDELVIAAHVVHRFRALDVELVEIQPEITKDQSYFVFSPNFDGSRGRVEADQFSR